MITAGMSACAGHGVLGIQNKTISKKMKALLNRKKQVRVALKMAADPTAAVGLRGEAASLTASIRTCNF